MRPYYAAGTHQYSSSGGQLSLQWRQQAGLYCWLCSAPSYVPSPTGYRLHNAGTRQVLSSRTPKAINTIQGQAPSGRHRLRTTRVAAAATQQASSSFEAARVVEFQHMGSSSSDGCGSRYSRSGGKKSFLTVAAAAAATIIVVSDQGRAAHYARPEGLQASNRDVEPLKMVLCVNQSLKMGKGKIGK